MKKILSILLLILIVNTLYSQKSLKYYEKGIKQFKKEKYREADSLFSLAINKLDDKTNYLGVNIYYDRGVSRLYMSDTSSFCSDMNISANSFDDRDAKSNYKTFCIKYNEQANKYYKQGLQEFELKNYESSDSLLSISINSYEFVDNVYLRGVVKLYMLDTISFCYEMEKIYNLNEQANQNFENICSSLEQFEKIFFVVEEMPLFNGKSSQAFREFIQKNLRYPVEAQKKGIKGRVFVQFDIDKHGNLVNAKIVKSAGNFLDNEVLRVVNMSPKWSPGLQRKKPVKVRFTFPIAFDLN